MTEKKKVLDLIWDKILKGAYYLEPELKQEGAEYYGDCLIGEKAKTGKNWKAKSRKLLSKQIEGSKYFMAQQKKNWEYFWPNNLKWYYAETKNYFAIGWLLETRTEKSLKKEGLT